MTTNEIKKALYREKPIARLVKKTEQKDGSLLYTYKCQSSLGYHYFNIPESDMGDKVFDDREPARLLIRWLTT